MATTTPDTTTPHAERAERIRRFNRFYTNKIGVLRERMFDSPFSLTEARVLFEISQHEETTAKWLRAELGMDAGYMSRLLSRFRSGGLVTRLRSPADGRQQLLRLTEGGRQAVKALIASSQQKFEFMLRGMTEENQLRLLGAMTTIENVFESPSEAPAHFLLRSHQPGDIGWTVYRHGLLYGQEYGWNEEFEALVAKILAEFILAYDPTRDGSWIAEMDGKRIGSVFLAHETEQVARLRLLLVDPVARGRGLGARLVDECIRFARRKEYDKLVLWTQSILVAARAIYENAGFTLIESKSHHSFGKDLVGENWELKLR